MPWGFTFEGGRGTEFYHQDPSIVITGVANHTPAADTLRYVVVALNKRSLTLENQGVLADY